TIARMPEKRPKRTMQPMAEPQAKLDASPVFMRVKNRTCVIVGGGAEAFAKARLLSQSSGDPVLLAEAKDYDFAEWLAAREEIRFEIGSFSSDRIVGATLVFAATGEEDADRAVVAAARAAGIPVNAVDRPHLCDFYMPALVNRAPVAVAIGTEGAGPVLAQMIRARIEQMLPPSLGRLAGLAASYRDTVERLLPPGNGRRGFWQRFFGGEPARAVAAGNIAAARRAADAMLDAAAGPVGPVRPLGHVALVGAGPGAKDLL